MYNKKRYNSLWTSWNNNVSFSYFLLFPFIIRSMCLESTPYMTYCSWILVPIWPSLFGVIRNVFYKLPTKPHPKHWSRTCTDNTWVHSIHTTADGDMSWLRWCYMFHSMYYEAFLVDVNPFSWAVKLSNAHFWILHFKDCFLAAAKQICACFLACLHKGQLSLNVSARK